MNDMGQALLAPPSVKGWDGGEVWIEGATANPTDEAARLEAVRRACV